MKPLRVRLTADVGDAAIHRAVVASLPEQYNLVDDKPDVVIATGADTVPVIADATGGATAVVLDRIGRLTYGQLTTLSAAAADVGALLVPAPRFAPRSVVDDSLFNSSLAELVESTITTTNDLRAALVEQLAVVRIALGPVEKVQVLRSGPTHYVVEATFVDGRETQVLLTGVTTVVAADQLELHAIGPQQHLSIDIDAGPFARPARIRYGDADGEQSPWPIHQHAHRLTLTRLHDTLSLGDRPLQYTADDLRADVTTAQTLDGG